MEKSKIAQEIPLYFYELSKASKTEKHTLALKYSDYEQFIENSLFSLG